MKVPAGQQMSGGAGVAIGQSLRALDLTALREGLRAVHGRQDGWWPASTRFEMMIGAVLVQNTRWQNVTMSLARLRDEDMLHPNGLLAAGEDTVREAIRPSGFMRAKAAALLSLTWWVVEREGQVSALGDKELRAELLAIRGIGPETADVIGLYAFDRPAFIADAYARRLLDSRGYAVPRTYEATRRVIEPAVRRSGMTADDLSELHGLIVEEGKRAG